MSTLGGGPRGTRPRADNDVYSALMLVAFLCMLAATVYVGYRASLLFGTLLPPRGS
jgi:hypothetical protein